jgi:hypothetical protein
LASVEQFVPVDSKALDWPRRVANAINGLRRSVGTRLDALERLRVAAVSTSSAVPADIDLLLVDASGGALVVSLPASNEGRVIYVKKVDASANAVTIDADGSDLIDGAGSMAISTQWASFTLAGFSGGWAIV